MSKESDQREQEEVALLTNIAANMPKLDGLLDSVNEKWCYEDRVYRFYHQSFKVYDLQSHTLAMVEVLQSLAPHLKMNDWFLEIVKDGTGKEFQIEDNAQWLQVTRPILEAFFHARYFLEMTCKYGKQLTSPPQMMPSGWAAVLYLFNLR